MHSLTMAKLFPRKIVRKIDHKWRSPLVQKRGIVEACGQGSGVETFHLLLPYVLVPPTSSLSTPRPPIAPTPVPAPSNPEGDMMIFD